MFGTLRLNSENNTNEFIEHAKGEDATALGGYVFCHSACYNCRSKKLRCSGQKSGCDRCKGRSFTCTYDMSIESRKSRQRSRIGEAASFETPYFSGAAGSPTGRAPSGVGTRDPASTSSNSVERGQQGTNNELHNTAKSNQDQSLDKNDYEVDYAELACAEDASTDIFVNITNSHSSKSDSVLIGDLASDDFMDEDYFAGLLNVDGPVFSPVPPSTISNPLSNCIDSLNSVAYFPGSPGSSTSHDSIPKRISKPSSTSVRGESSGGLNQESGRPGRRAAAQTEPSCQCLHSMLRLLDEVEAKTMAMNSSTVDAILAYHKNALRHGNDVLSCRTCCGRSEYMTLLAIISDKLTTLSERIVAAFIFHVQGQDESRKQHFTDTSSEWRNGKMEMRLGEYEVETHKEWTFLFTAAIVLQLKESMIHVRKVSVVAASIHRGVQVQGLKNAERRLKDMIAKMQQVIADSDIDDD